MAGKYQIVLIGGGTAGITVAARLRRADASLDIAIIEPSSKHYYHLASSQLHRFY
jgi:sulfide:quinone oxidoreductase